MAKRAGAQLYCAAHIAAALGLVGLALLVLFTRPAAADMASALQSCLAPREAGALVALLEGHGWREATEPAAIDVALTDAMTLTFLRSGEPDTWDDTAERSAGLAERQRRAVGYDAVRLLTHPSGATLTLETNRAGNPTCLYVGPETDLSAFAEIDLFPVSDGIIERIRHDSVSFGVRLAATALNAETDVVSPRATFTAVHLRPPRG